MDPELFFLNVTGQISKGDFPDLDDLYCKYSFNYGKDWIVTSGIEEGISQMTTSKLVDESFNFTWNLPLDISFKSTNVFGWPQLSVCVYGLDFFGNDVVRGYGAIHIPLMPGSHCATFPVVVPSSSSIIQRLSSWLTGRRPEFTDPKMITQGEGRDVVRVTSQGMISASFNIMTKNMDNMGYRVLCK